MWLKLKRHFKALSADIIDLCRWSRVRLIASRDDRARRQRKAGFHYDTTVHVQSPSNTVMQQAPPEAAPATRSRKSLLPIKTTFLPDYEGF